MAQSTGNRVYENYDPPHDWAQDDVSKTLILMLPGFRRDQMKVQVTSSGVLKVSGERQMDQNRWRRFSKQFTLDSDVDTSDIGAKFEGGLLFVKFRKIMPQEPTPPEVPKAETPPPTQKPDEQKAPAEVAPPPKPEEDKKAEAKADDTIAQKKQEQDDAKGKGKMEAEAQEKKKSPNGLGEKAKAISPKAQEKLENAGGLVQGEAKVDGRLPTRVLRLGSTQQYKEALVGLIVVVKKQSKLINLIVAILVVLVLGLYVKNAINSYSGGAEIEEL